MQPGQSILTKRSKGFISLLLAGVVLLLGAVSASPSVHELFHKDADSTKHQCAATLFADGQVDSTPVEVAATLSVVPVEMILPFEFSVFSPVIQNLPAGRAPPVSISFAA